MSPIFYIIISVIFAIVFICGAIFLIYHFNSKKYNDFILKNSICLKQLIDINSRYNFYPDKKFDQYHTYDNEKYYDSISCEDYLIYQLQYIRNNVFTQIKNVKINRQQYSQYLSEVNSITQTGQFQSPVKNLKLNKLIKKERILIEKHKYKAPVTQFLLTVTLYCATINGDVYDGKSKIFSSVDIYALAKRLTNKNGNFYNDRGIWDALCRVERGKVSNKMRFSIYERDGYRCRNCGVSERYAQLEIDHIIPIAKGGKSTYDNLQTLCHKCNVEKGDTYKKQCK